MKELRNFWRDISWTERGILIWVFVVAPLFYWWAHGYLRDCIGAAVADGHLSKEAADDALARYDDLVGDFVGDGKLGYHEAQVRAAGRLQKEIEREATRRKRMRLFQAQAQDRIRARIAAAPKGQADKAALAVLGFDPSGRFGGENVEARHQSLRRFAFARMWDFIDKYRSKAGGLTRSTAGMEDVVRGLFGEDTTPAARVLAQGIMEARDYLRGRGNAAGMDIVQLKAWGWVQHHDRAAIARTPKAEWIDYTLDRLDPDKMRDAAGEVMTARQMRSAVEGAYDTILTGGLDQMAGAFDKTFTSPVNARIAHRELVFRDARAWLEYQKRFGSPDMFGAIIGEVERLSRDVALVEVMGPYPRASLKALQQAVDTDRAGAAEIGIGRKAAKLAEKIGGHGNLEAVYDQVSGAANIPTDSGWARVSQSNRNLVVAARLGGALFTSLSDFGTATLTAKMNGVPVTRLIGEYFRQLNPASKADRRMAARAGFIAETSVGHAVAAQRILGEVTGAPSTARIADTTMRLSGLNAWTDAGRTAFKLSLIGHLTDNAGKAFDKLDKATRGALERYGIDAADWDRYRSTPIWTDPETGAELIRPEDVWLETQGARMALGEHDAHFRAANKFNDMIEGETAFAVVTPSARVRAMITGNTKPGSLIGEAVRNAALFRSFGVAFIFQHWQRAMAQRGFLSKGKYLAWATIGMTVGGAIAEQASSLYRGEDPRDMSDPKFWGSAFARGGSLGPIGDFLFSDVSRHGNTLAEAMLGPVLGGEVLAGFNASVGNARELIEKGEVRNAAPEIRRFAQGLTPGGSLWYTRLAFERLVLDELEAWGNPDANAKFARMERRAREDFHTRYWWRPGETAPDRAPGAP